MYDPKEDARRTVRAMLFRAEPADVDVQDHGSIFLLTPNSDDAREWLGEHIGDDATWFGPALVVEHRYVDAIIEGMREDGLVVE